MSDIDQILYPTILSDFREDIPPVICIVWKGGNEYETIQFNKVYPFDTIDDIKRLICNHYSSDPGFIPRFTFVGVPLGETSYSTEPPSLNTTYIPLDWLWFPSNSTDPKLTYILNNPRKVLTNPDLRFVASDGSYTSPNYEPRGRSTIEDVFLKPRDNRIPVLHVYPLQYLLREYAGPIPISESDWNKRFAPYYLYVNIDGPYQATDEDTEFAKKIHFFVKQRESTINRLNNYLEEGSIQGASITVTGIRQLRLTWKKPVSGFEGSGYLFYRIPVTQQRPYSRLIPGEGSPVTKLHVKGILPIPTLEDPNVIKQWGNDASPTPGIDFLYFKYIHKPSISSSPPIYGTVRIFNDGTQDLLLQPPNKIKKLNPQTDFKVFPSIIKNVLSDLPQSFDTFKLGEIAAIFALKLDINSKIFNKARIQKRLPIFTNFLTEINPLPNESPIISLRYKAISQYASEDKIFTFITQFTTNKQLSGENPDASIIAALQNEFKFSKKEAITNYSEWYKKNGIFTLQVPEEGEFIESFNPGIDIHIFAHHPSYYCQVNRVNSYETYVRILTVISLLFVEEDGYFVNNTNSNVELSKIQDELEKVSIYHQNGVDLSKKPVINDVDLEDDSKPGTDESPTNMDIHGWLQEDPFANEATEKTTAQATEKTKETTAQATEKTKETTAQATYPQKEINPTSWFIKKLQDIDPGLFIFKPTDGSSKSEYSRSCASYDGRQPAILTEDLYTRMRTIYKNDPIFWIIYPLVGNNDPVEPVGMEETITLMRYGSDTSNINYYFCPKYYCLSDEIMVREKDFKAKVDRNGNDKPENTCPFCRGKLITTNETKPGHTVIKRKDKKKDEYHKYINFLTKAVHPQGYRLPCCFLAPTTTKKNHIRISDPAYARIEDFFVLKKTDSENQSSTDDDEGDYGNLVIDPAKTIEYSILFQAIRGKYILESNKNPDSGIFATAPTKFDKFFAQKSSESLVTRATVNLKLRANANGFLRIGTENTVYESLLGVIAPLIFKNSINEVKNRILEVVIPRIFINAHFGNLVLEFYNPSDKSAMPPTKQELMSWCSVNLGITITSTNLYPAIRLYNAYKRFINFIEDPTQRKDLRHIQPLLSEPGLFTPNGIQLIVLENIADQPITIKCPTFGVSVDINKKNDFAFISRSLINIGTTGNVYARYELYLHTSHRAAKGGESEKHETIIRWDYASRKYWPQIVRRRIDEYVNQCQSKHRSIYTLQEGVNQMAMIPLSKAVDAAPYRPEGIVKDLYNHIVGVTFRSKPGATTLVTLPVVDDGIISISSAFSIKNIYLDWDDVKAAPVEDVISYYKKNLESLFSLYPGYKVKYIARQAVDNKIVAVQLENGIYIPAAPPKNEIKMEEFSMKIVTVDQFEWQIDKQIVGVKKPTNNEKWENTLDNTITEKKCDIDPELLRKSTFVQFEESYQQFRLIVSNWISTKHAGSEIRKGIEDIIFNKDLPEYEKRKRLYIYISTTLLSWFYPDDDESWEAPTALLRKDCRLIDKEENCTGSCYWKTGENNSGKCLLHVHDTTQLSEIPGKRDVSTPELFVKRVIDELVRFPNRRKQLMRQGSHHIYKISAIIEPILQDDQYIIPESSPTWTNLLRMDWASHIPEKPQYYEEMSRNAEASDEKTPQGELPPKLQEILGEDTHLRISLPDVPSKSHPFVPFQSVLGVTLQEIGLDNDSTKINESNLIKYVKIKSKPIGIFDLTTDNIYFLRPYMGSFDSVTILVVLDTQIGLLIQEHGDSTVKISALPENIQEKWKNAALVPLKTKPPIAAMPEVVTVAENPIVVKPKPKPLIAQIKYKPLVKSDPQPAPPPVSQHKDEKPRRKRPQIAPNNTRKANNKNKNKNTRVTKKRKPPIATE